MGGNPGSNHHASAGLRSGGLSRRALAQGVAWSTPALFGASPPKATASSCLTSQTHTWSSPGVYALTIPAGCSEIAFTVAGGGGGFSFNPANPAGLGAKYSGSFTRPTRKPFSLTIVVGGGGEGGGNDVAHRGGGGYGKGGDTQTNARVVGNSGAGGGGSAILLGEVAANDPIVVAGGGAGADWNWASGTNDCVHHTVHLWDPIAVSRGNGGLPTGGNGQRPLRAWISDHANTSMVYGRLFIQGGEGALREFGGYGGGQDPSYLNSFTKPVAELYGGAVQGETSPGGNGGDHGTGSNGGGDGGAGALPWGTMRLDAWMTADGGLSGAGGGGGFAGGGGGSSGVMNDTTCARWIAMATAGGGGSSYTRGTPTTPVSVGTSGYGGVGSVKGADGFVTLSW